MNLFQDNPIPAKVSFIVPVYNVERHLKRCINSILSQSYTNFECILINDASPDNSAKICDEFAKKDNRIKVIHKTINEGLPKARQTGVSLATGNFIQFIDSDDWIKPEMTERLVMKAINESCDIVYCDFICSTENNEFFLSYTPIDITNLEKIHIIRHLLDWTLPWSACNKLFSKNLFRNIIYPERTAGEDAFIVIQLFLNAQKIGYEYSILYHYFQNPKSIMNSNSRKFINRQQVLENFIHLNKIFSKKSEYKIYQPLLIRKIKSYNRKINFRYKILKLIKFITPYGLIIIFNKFKK